MEKYEKVKLIGRGAHGTVFLCHEKSNNKLVIVKEIPVDQLSKDERQASMVEAKVLSMLDHPNVIAYYENFLEEKTMVIVMEYAQGGTLFDFLQQRNEKPLEEQEVLYFFCQMLHALQHVHSKLILHRDLKSQNIMLNTNKTIVKIGDFGISKILSSKSKAYTVVGTPCYISPELCEGKPYNQKSDIWALGCILYELMTLKRPFDANNLPALVMKIMKGNFDPVPEIYSKDLRHLLMNMLHLDPNQRPTPAQIMCQPFMINITYRLYIEVGSLPCINQSENCTSKSTSLIDISSMKIKDNSGQLYSFDSTSTKVEAKHKLYLFCEDNVLVLPVPARKVMKEVSFSVNQKIGLTEDGFLITWKQKKLSSSNDSCSKTPTSFIASIVDERFAVNIVSAVCGIDFTVCLSDSGVVFTFGKASSRCLAHGTKNDVVQPRIVEALFGHDIVSIACGPRHVLAVSEDSEVFAWGFGNNGCLGLGKAEFCDFPQEIQLPHHQKPLKVFCGHDCSFIITDDKSLLACGSNRHNKLAMDSGEGHQIDEARVFTPTYSEPISDVKIKAVASAKSHTVILSDDGEVFTVGSNRYSQLGWGKPGLDYSMPGKIKQFENIKVAQIACANSFSLAITAENVLYSWGKCPKSLLNRINLRHSEVEIPEVLKKEKVLSASCSSENCFILCNSLENS